MALHVGQNFRQVVGAFRVPAGLVGIEERDPPFHVAVRALESGVLLRLLLHVGALLLQGGALLLQGAGVGASGATGARGRESLWCAWDRAFTTTAHGMFPLTFSILFPELRIKIFCSPIHGG